MSTTLTILLARLLIPVVIIIFGVSFYLSIDAMARSEKLFPIVLIAGALLVAVAIIAREIYGFVVSRRAPAAAALQLVDADGLRTIGWKRSVSIAGACLLYLFAIQSLGLLLTGFLVYVVCAATLIPEKSVWRHWLFALIGAAIAGVLFDLVFRVWLGLPLPGLSL